MIFYIESPAILAPGLDDWFQAKRVFNGDIPYKSTPILDPMPSIIPANIQRRCSYSTLLAIGVAEQTLNSSSRSADDINAVFASSVGDPEIDNKLCISVSADEPMPSPIQFHNSVHNAPAGYWSIATRSQSHTTSLAAGGDSFTASLLSAYSQMSNESKAVMLVAYDQPLQGGMSVGHTLSRTFACSLLLSPYKSDNSLISVDLDLVDFDAGKREPEKSEVLAELTDLFRTVPAAKSLSLFSLLARPEYRTLIMDYTSDISVVLTCQTV